MRFETENPPALDAVIMKMISYCAFCAGLVFVALGDYNPYALAAILGFAFFAYIGVRTLVFWENEGFSPNRIQVGMSWVFLGIHANTSEFDTRPVRTYCAILILLVLGVILRPFLRYALWGNPAEAVAF